MVTDEEIERERQLEADLYAAVDSAIALSIALKRDYYAITYLQGLIERRFPFPKLPPRVPKKAVIPAALRTAVFERDAYRCKHCGSWSDLTADHILPESKGGAATLENLQTLCRSCNSKKSNR